MLPASRPSPPRGAKASWALLVSRWASSCSRVLRRAAPVPAGRDLELSWGRTPLVTAISSDEGKTWKHKKLLESAPNMGYCYIAIHFADGAALLAYGHGGGGVDGVLQNQRMRRITLDWLYSEELPQ